MNRITQITKNWRWSDYGIMLLVLVFAVFNRAMPIVMGVTALSLIIIRNDLSDIKRLLSFKYPFIWFIIFFLVHFAGLINSSNLEFAMSDIGMKASLIGVPVFLILTKIKLRFDQVINGYLASLMISLVYLYLFAIYRSFDAAEDNHWGYFTESYFSALMHRSYFATYLAIGVLISIYRFFQEQKGRIYYVIMGLFMFAGMIQTYSKAGILIFAVLMVPLVYYLIAKKFSKLYGLLAVGVFTLVLAISIGSSSRLSDRFQFMISGFVNHQTSGNVSIESNASRMIMWSTSIQLFSENLLIGVGTGDVRDELDLRNAELGNDGVVEHSLNSHNQYLNTSVQLGLMGLIPLVLCMLTALMVAIRKRNLILVLMLAGFVITMLFESFLETQAGLIPVCLFTLLPTLILLNQDSDPNKESSLE